MGFLSVCRALYDYAPQGEGELEIHEGEILYILEKGSDDDWWKAKRKADDDDEDEPEGLIPNNYVEEATPTSSAKALYDYTRQTDEEVSFTEDTALEVYDTSDPDWTLVGINGDFGFAPANYIELTSAAVTSPALPSRPIPSANADHTISPVTSSPVRASGPAADLARVLGGGAPQTPTSPHARTSDAAEQMGYGNTYDDVEEEAPALPRRPPSQSISSGGAERAISPEAVASPPRTRISSRRGTGSSVRPANDGFLLYNVSEMVSALGKRKKMPTTLGLNLTTGTIMLSPERSRDGPAQEWTAEKLQHYSIEGKHVFLELVRPSKSLDLHAGSKDVAERIVGMLGEIAGYHRGEGLREVLAAASGQNGQKKGQMLYDFMAQGDDEVTVAVGDEVIVLDDSNEEWWLVRRLKNNKEGVVPNSYVDVTGFVPSENTSRSGINAVRSTIEQNRLEEERLTKEAARSHKPSQNGTAEVSGDNEVGPGMKLPQRGSSLAEDDSRRGSKRDKRSSRSETKASRSKPDAAKTRTWTDHSGSFRVEAQFIGLADGKIHLHKQNGVKIAVPVSKMSPTDLEYVEKATGESLEDYLPVAVLMERKKRAAAASKPKPSASANEGQTGTSDYDWFEFFLQAGVNHHQCERYAQSMVRDSMDESVLPEITTEILRNLGVKEGDAIKVMKFLDQKMGRQRGQSIAEGATGDAAGGLFSGPGGALYNNTKRGRPETNRATSDVVDAKALQTSSGEPHGDETPAQARETPLVSAPKPEKQINSFDDDAWEVRPRRPTVTQAPESSVATTVNSSAAPATGAMADLSLLTPLQPTIATPTISPPQAPAPAQPPQNNAQPPAAVQQFNQQQQSGASPSFFSQIPGQGAYQGAPQQPSQGYAPQQTSPINLARQRPAPPPQGFGGNALLAPPPRPLSAPQNQQNSQFGLGPLQPQLTGLARPAPLGQSLEELNQQRLQQQYLQQQQQLQAQRTGFVPQQQYGAPINGFQPQMTGFVPQQNQLQPYLTNGNSYGSPFADPGRTFLPPVTNQQTGFGGYPNQGPPPGGINSVLPPALQPQKTATQQPIQQFLQPQQTSFQQTLTPQYTGYQPQQALQPQITGFQPQSQFGQQQLRQNGFTNGYQAPPVPQIPTQPSIAPLQPQKTGPAPPVRFGVVAGDLRKLTPQPTGRRANLTNASKYFSDL